MRSDEWGGGGGEWGEGGICSGESGGLYLNHENKSKQYNVLVNTRH